MVLRFAVLVILLFFILLSGSVVSGQGQYTAFVPGDRTALGRFLDHLGLKSGVVVHNLQDPFYMIHLITDWHGCEELTVVFGMSNKKELSTIETLYRERTMEIIKEQTKSVSRDRVHLNFLTNDDEKEPYDLVDFVYLHFPHEDYCLVNGLLTKWWANIRPGGILSGFNFADDNVQTQFLRDYDNHIPEDWVFCPGTQETRRAGLVRESVTKFAREQNTSVYATTERDILHTFILQKPI